MVISLCDLEGDGQDRPLEDREALGSEGRSVDSRAASFAAIYDDVAFLSRCDHAAASRPSDSVFEAGPLSTAVKFLAFPTRIAAISAP